MDVLYAIFSFLFMSGGGAFTLPRPFASPQEEPCLNRANFTNFRAYESTFPFALFFGKKLPRNSSFRLTSRLKLPLRNWWRCPDSNQSPRTAPYGVVHCV